MGTELDVVIVGGGPAGFTAGIYAGRSGLTSMVLEKALAGGQMSTAYLVENWPGDKVIPGADLTARMRAHAEQYTKIQEFSEVVGVAVDGVFSIRTPEGEIKAKALILATGAEHRKIGVPGEAEFAGKGVSYCATCDGFFFKGKRVYVIGGGNTAGEYALYLKNIGCDVTMVHRRSELRAEKKLQEEIFQMGIEVLWSTTVEGFRGERGILESIVVKDLVSGSVRTLKADGAFVAVGEVPNNAVAGMLSLEMDEEGYVKVDRGMRTSRPGVYAAGDLTGGLKQIVVAAGEGAVAATSVFEDLRSPYWITC
jgi:thioredoxin reductase (NADPH)